MIKYLQSRATDTDSVLIQTAYRQIKRDFGFLAEPFTLHTYSPELLAATWILVRETTLTGGTDRGIKEVIATAVSEANRCPYCVDAHTIMFQATGGSGKIGMCAPSRWGMASRTPDAAILQQPPFSPADIPEIYGTAVAFHYINRMVSIFLAETPLPVNLRPLKSIQLQMVSLWLGRVVKRSKRPGESLSLLPAGHLPESLNWAKSSTNVAAALGRWVAAVAQVGEQALTAEGRACVSRHLANWQGEDLPLGHTWLDEATGGLQGEDLAGARLGLLVALCPYRVTERHINDFRKYQPTDEALVGATAWASQQAALKVASWWPNPVPD